MEYVTVKTRMWQWNEYVGQLLAEDYRLALCYLYLFTNDKITISGVYYILPEHIALDLRLETDFVKKAFKRFEKDGKILYRGHYLFVKNFLKNQYYHKSPSVKQKAMEQVMKAPPEIVEEFFKLYLNNTRITDLVKHIKTKEDYFEALKQLNPSQHTLFNSILYYKQGIKEVRDWYDEWKQGGELT